MECGAGAGAATDAGAGAGAGARAAGASAATAAAVTSFGSRLTKPRSLRTSTCPVRYLPVESVFLISLVCLRVSVILFFASAEPCALRRYSSSRDLSDSLSESSGTFLSTPAARSCSSSTDGGTFSSLANWATLVCATLCRLLAGSGLLRSSRFEPVRPGGHDQLLRLLFVQLSQGRQFIDRQIRQVVARLDAALREFRCQPGVHSVQLQQLGIDAFHLLLVGDRRHQERVAGAVAQLADG